MAKAEQSMEEINTLLFDDEAEAFDGKEHDVASRQQKTEPRLLKQRGLSSELEQLEAVPYYKRPLVQAAVLLVFALPLGWGLISAFSTGETSKPQLNSAKPSSDRENQLLKESLEQERKKNQDLAIENGLKMQQMEVVPVPVRTKPSSQQEQASPVVVPPSKPKVVYVPAPRRAYVTSSVAASRPTPLPPRPSAPVIPRPLTRVISQPLAPAKVEPKTDPMEQWFAAANVGSYGSMSPASNSQTAFSQPANDSTYQTGNYQTASAVTEDSNSQPSGGLGKPPAPIEATDEQTIYQTNNSVALSRQAENLLNSSYRSVTYSTAVNSLVIGTRAAGKIETPIAWSGKLENPSQNFLIQLKEPLLASDKSVAIPKGAYLVAQVSNASETGLVQMAATEVVVTKDGQTTSQPLPEGAILILGKGGKPLQAKATRRGSTGNNLGMIVLSGAAAAAGLANQAISQSSFSSGGGFSTTTTSRDPNYLAGFGQGAAQAIVQQMQNRHQQAIQTLQSEPLVFVLNQGTSVQVFVNQSVSI